MIKSCADANSEITKLLMEKGLSKYDNQMDAEYLGDVGVDIRVNLYISNMENFAVGLKKLSDADDSPLSNDGYTGIEIYEPNWTGNTHFMLDTSFIIDDEKNQKMFISSLLSNNIKQNNIDTILDKCVKLCKLGFDSISLIDSSNHQEWFEEEQKKRKSE